MLPDGHHVHFVSNVETAAGSDCAVLAQYFRRIFFTVGILLPIFLPNLATLQNIKSPTFLPPPPPPSQPDSANRVTFHAGMTEKTLVQTFRKAKCELSIQKAERWESFKGRKELFK